MRQWRSLLVAGIAALAWLGCSDETSGPDGPPFGPAPAEYAELIVSDPLGPAVAPGIAASGGAVSMTFVSLPPGTFPEAESVRILNVTSGGDPIIVPMVDGGFDPVLVPADAGDLLELEFHGTAGVLDRKYGTVPVRRPPVIVRTSPPQGRTDVALGVRPTAVFSEPVDPASLDAAVSLLLAGAQVEGQAVSRPAEPWVVEFVPASSLEAESEYELVLGQGVRDLDGDTLGTAYRASFTTQSAAPPPPPPPPGPFGTERIAFVSTRSGEPWIYLANADGSGVRPLVAGEAPAWSRDGRMIAFNRGSSLRVINADRSAERGIAAVGYHPTWSPDGTRLAFSDGTGRGTSLRVINLDGSGGALALRHDFAGPDGWLGRPVWWPRGDWLAFEYRYWDGGAESVPGGVYIVNIDGSDPRQLTNTFVNEPSFDASFRDPSWSPDGNHIAVTNAFPRQPSESYTWAVGHQSTDNTSFQSALYSVDPDAPSAEGADWSPDGRLIAYGGALDRKRIWVVSADEWDLPFVHRQLIPEVSGPDVVEGYRDYDVAWSRIAP